METIAPHMKQWSSEDYESLLVLTALEVPMPVALQRVDHAHFPDK